MDGVGYIETRSLGGNELVNMCAISNNTVTESHVEVTSHFVHLGQSVAGQCVDIGR